MACSGAWRWRKGRVLIAGTLGNIPAQLRSHGLLQTCKRSALTWVEAGVSLGSSVPGLHPGCCLFLDLELWLPEGASFCLLPFLVSQVYTHTCIMHVCTSGWIWWGCNDSHISSPSFVLFQEGLWDFSIMLKRRCRVSVPSPGPTCVEWQL